MTTVRKTMTAVINSSRADDPLLNVLSLLSSLSASKISDQRSHACFHI